MVRQLVERIRQKDQRAMAELYQQYVGELASVCYRYVPQENDAKDVLQNRQRKHLTLNRLKILQHRKSHHIPYLKGMLQQNRQMIKNQRQL